MANASRQKQLMYWLQLPFWALLILLVLAALYVLAGRAMMAQLPSWRPAIVKEVAQHLPFDLSLDQLQGRMVTLDPALRVQGLSLGPKATPFLSIQKLQVQPSLMQSLIQWQPVFARLSVDALDVWLEEGAHGWHLRGLAEDNELPSEETVHWKQQLQWLELLLAQGQLQLDQLRLHLKPLKGESITLESDHFDYRHWSQGRQLDLAFFLPEGQQQPGRLLLTQYGDDFSWANGELEAYLDLPQVALSALTPLFPPDQVHPVEGEVGLKAWAHWQDGQGQAEVRLADSQGRLSNDLKWQLQQAAFSVRGDFQQWQAQWQFAAGQFGQRLVPAMSGRLQYDDQKWQLKLADFALQDFQSWWNFPLLPEKLQDVLQTLSPQGVLKGTTLSWPDPDLFNLKAQLLGGAAKGWQGTPAVSGLDAWVEATAHQGRVKFNQHQLSLEFPELFDQGWRLDQAQGVVHWALDGAHPRSGVEVRGDHLVARLPVGTVTGQFNLNIAPQGEPDTLLLNLGLSQVATDQVARYLPSKILDSSLDQWLKEAIQAGAVRQGGILFSGPVTGADGTFQMTLDVSDGQLAYDPRWPAVHHPKGVLDLMDEKVHAEVEQAEVLGAQVTHVTVDTHRYQDEPWLKVNGQVSGSGDTLESLFDVPALQGQLPEILRRWDIGGHLNADLALDVPLISGDQNPQVSVTTKLENNQLDMIDPPIKLTQINGPLKFTLREGLSSSGLTAQLWNGPVKAMIVPDAEGERILLQGDADLTPLKQWLDILPLRLIEGRLNYHGQLQLSEVPQLHLESDLAGVEVNYPAPLGKTGDQLRPMTADIQLSEIPRIDLAYGEKLTMALSLTSPRPTGMLIATARHVPTAVLPREPGMALYFQLPQTDLLNWEDWWQRYGAVLGLKADDQAPAGVVAQNNQGKAEPLVNDNVLAETPTPPAIRKIYAGIEHLYRGQTDYGPVYTEANWSEQGISAFFTSDYTDGQLQWPWAPDQRAQLSVAQLLIPDTKAVPADSGPSVDTPDETGKPARDLLADIDPTVWPPLDIHIARLKIGERQLGRWTLGLQPKSEGLHIEPLEVSLGESTASGWLDWQSQGQAQTRMQVTIDGQNVGGAVQALVGGGPAPVTSQTHHLNISGAWPGSPAALTLSSINAQIGLQLSNGNFPKIDSASAQNASRLFSLFNFDSLIRRLQLDFSDLTGKGISYNNVEGHFSLSEGVLTNSKPAKVEASSTSFTMNGSVDLNRQTLDLTLSVVLPVSQNLPLAAVVAGAPQVGAAIWVVQKVFGNLFDEFTQARYHISGALDDPKVELIRVF